MYSHKLYSFYNIDVGKKLYVRRNSRSIKIDIGNVEIEVSEGTHVYKPYTSCSPRKPSIEYVESITILLNKLADLFEVEYSLPLSILDHIINSLTEYIAGKESYRELVRRLAKYIGLGKGSTPEYDDVLSGLIYSYNFYSLKRGHPPIYGEDLLWYAKTTLLSRIGITGSARGLAPKPIIDLVNCIYGCNRCDRVKTVNILAEALSIGSSTGYYMALGTLYAAKALARAERY